MSIEEPSIVDVISIDNLSGNVVLGISDHLGWNENSHDDNHNHLWLLQEKINSYLAFVESGEIFDSYPKAKGRNIVIAVVGKYPLIEQAIKFYDELTKGVEQAGFRIEFRLLK